MPLETAADLYAKDHEGFGVEVTEILSDDIETMLTTAVSAGDLSTLPDIFLMQDNSFQKYVANYPDIFTDLTDSGIDFSQFSQAKVAYSTVDGKNLWYSLRQRRFHHLPENRLSGAGRIYRGRFYRYHLV